MGCPADDPDLAHWQKLPGNFLPRPPGELTGARILHHAVPFALLALEVAALLALQVGNFRQECHQGVHSFGSSAGTNQAAHQPVFQRCNMHIILISSQCGTEHACRTEHADHLIVCAGWRDPFVLEKPSPGSPWWYVMVGAGLRNECGTALVYRSLSLTEGGCGGWRG